MADQDAPPARQRRSPGYPGIDLRTALERNLDLYGVSSKQPIPLTVAAEEWGYSAKSSSNLVVAAALKRFGLVRDVGSAASRQLALTDEGRELAFLDQERDSVRWRELVRDAALRPKIHRQVLDHFEGSMPDDRIALRYLLFELGFTDESTAKDFLKRLRATLLFADVEGGREVIASSEQAADEDSRQAAPFAGATALRGGEPGQPLRGDVSRPPEPSIYDHFRADRTFVQVPYSHGQWATVQAAFPLTEDEWNAFIGMLEAMKLGLVRAPEPAAQSSENSVE
jgi:hypothetical protein